MLSERLFESLEESRKQIGLEIEEVKAWKTRD